MTDVIKSKKKSVPKVVKDLSWNKWVGEDVAKTKCLCCGVNEIKMSSFHCGHVISLASGGKTTVDNLRPICAACNLSMGTENLNDFKIKCGFNSTPPLPASKEIKVISAPIQNMNGYTDEQIARKRQDQDDLRRYVDSL